MLAAGKGSVTITTGDSRVSVRDAADYAFEELEASLKGMLLASGLISPAVDA